MADARPIGLFDSGVGGLTVLAQIVRLLPHESIVYFADTLNLPYGDKTPAELIALGDRIIRFLLAQGVKCVVFACNTSSSISLEVLQQRYPVPMLGLLQAGARLALKSSRRGRIGILATAATVKSGAYEKAIKDLCPQAQVFSQAAPRLVPLIESGEIDTPEAEAALREYLTPLKEAGIDTLIFGCTHYPFLAPLISSFMGPGVALVDPAVAVVEELKELLSQKGLLANSTPFHRIFVSGDPESFDRLARRLYPDPLPPAVRVDPA
ncbi:glutamate racemase [Ammonifex degensii KC4]|uniref:Glutamate racemase n=1 Tax=Ammonifex degensii (strain DSM 10501 / KC4) TaxID=429009 RepID=C9RBK3_AMMDK|nr:glutamate racemase [Ammonifex degensii]ACX51630.1 glutamate racemase [Ammonifex degensii KC4]